MKWKAKTEFKPYHGQKIQTRKFAFLPIKDINGNCVWLENVIITKEYRIDPNGHWIIKAVESED